MKTAEALKSGTNSNAIYLEGYYSERLGLTGNIEEDVYKLYDFYNERMYDKTDAKSIRDTIHEYIVLFNNRGVCGAEIVADKISMVSRKSSNDKKNIGYLIGCLRHVLEYGVSATGGYNEKRLINAFETKYNYTMSTKGVARLLVLSTSNSTADVLFTILENGIDIEEMLFDRFEYLMKNKKENL